MCPSWVFSQGGGLAPAAELASWTLAAGFSIGLHVMLEQSKRAVESGTEKVAYGCSIQRGKKERRETGHVDAENKPSCW